MAKPPPRLYVPDSLEAGTALALSREHAHYLGTVLRLGPGAELLLFNGRDGEWAARLEAVSRKGAVAIPISQTREQEGEPDITLFFAPLKKGPTEVLIQKATELGVRVLQPVITARTVNHRPPMDRWRMIAVEAAEQSERLTIPEFGEAVPLEAVIRETRHPIAFCDEAGDDPSQRWGGQGGRGAAALTRFDQFRGQQQKWGLLIGPEGGFTPHEREKLRAKEEIVPISLGPRILKAETAAITALALWQAVLGDL